LFLQSQDFTRLQHSFVEFWRIVRVNVVACFFDDFQVCESVHSMVFDDFSVAVAGPRVGYLNNKMKNHKLGELPRSYRHKGKSRELRRLLHF
jgi:hypothetical protein